MRLQDPNLERASALDVCAPAGAHGRASRRGARWYAPASPGLLRGPARGFVALRRRAGTVSS